MFSRFLLGYTHLAFGHLPYAGENFVSFGATETTLQRYAIILNFNIFVLKQSFQFSLYLLDGRQGPVELVGDEAIEFVSRYTQWLTA